MEYSRLRCLLIYLLWTALFQDVASAPQWGGTCPKECQCGTSEISQPLLSKWQHQKGHVKTAVCVFPLHTLHNMLMLPYDTQSFSFIQGMDNKNILLDGTLTRMLQNLQSMGIQGTAGITKLEIAEDTFAGMSNLMYLSLQRVNITRAEKAFVNLHSLEVLQVINCDLPFLKWQMLKGLSKLKELYMVQSKIKELQDFAFYGTPELRKLFLAHNELFSVEADALVGLLKLEHLDLSNNKIDHISGLTFPPLPQLQQLELKHNPIRALFPHCFRFLNRTKHLTLGHKHQPVHIMKFSFRGLASLTFLHIPNIDNDILNEHMFYDLPSLTHLHLQGRVKVINRHAFNGAHKVLQKLVLHECKLERILEQGFYHLAKLLTLDLSSNLLEYLPERILEPLESLQELILSENLFKSLQIDIFQPLAKLQALRLDGNAWNCNCNMSSWDKEIVSKVSHMQHTHCKNNSNPSCKGSEMFYKVNSSVIPKCENPLMYRGEDVFNVLKQHFTCN